MIQYLTVQEAANQIGVSTATLRRWDKLGKFSPLRHPLNNYRVYSLQQIERLKENFNNIEQRPTINLKEFIHFETQLGKLYNMDVIKFLGQLENNSVDMIFADPPYNINKAEWDTFQSQQEYVEWSLEWIREANRVLKENGTLYVCGFSEILADLKWAASSFFKGCKWLVWFYRNKANMGNDWGRSHESILHFRKSKDLTFNIDEARVPYNQHTLKYPKHPQAETSQYGNGKSYEWVPNPKGAKPKDVFEIPTIANKAWEKVEHPTQKPIELVKKCILVSSNENDLVVDPFGGSGTTYIIAEAFKRKWLGCELNQEYCRVIKKRFDGNTINRLLTADEEINIIKRRQKLRG
jgi:site-specific DNA-methyltransferase (adenine-specific)